MPAIPRAGIFADSRTRPAVAPDLQRKRTLLYVVIFILVECLLTTIPAIIQRLLQVCPLAKFAGIKFSECQFFIIRRKIGIVGAETEIIHIDGLLIKSDLLADFSTCFIFHCGWFFRGAECPRINKRPQIGFLYKLINQLFFWYIRSRPNHAAAPNKSAHLKHRITLNGRESRKKL